LLLALQFCVSQPIACHGRGEVYCGGFGLCQRAPRKINPPGAIARFLSIDSGVDEELVKAYIRNQEQEDERYGQMKLGM
jgi:hypothetical protein